ncbi:MULTISPECIES: MarR family transcriptional regulator [unclassified Clostridioides]|uniref:MarR family winged helix-turn-helix transcriptional regulator n=1 Tax=unclassified Clostridioides TaxID=2635829 RepID=UPI001D109EE3|nr:MarR family transcriptional regulator [Clostridioides sp. ZZV14-6045]MCC0730705.1 MarR family transcriptional regulator [Clostridioides sp. ZZV14-6048]MCC0734940.1 MarR family transcriptional regulator [Clostridioides sp. ZZV14-6009]MCC0738518.1 MarR family transcriptional regulator [Clostridioides sp. ZZV14-5902]
MRDYSKLITLMERIIHKYNQWEDKKRTYGTELLLSKSEIHTIVAVGNNPGINITSLADTLGITKGAASQMIYKLVDKGTVVKKVSPDSDTEVALSLTDDGMKNYKAHQEYHKQTNDESLKLLDDMPEPFYEYMLSYFSAFEESIDKKLEEN